MPLPVWRLVIGAALLAGCQPAEAGDGERLLPEAGARRLLSLDAPGARVIFNAGRWNTTTHQPQNRTAYLAVAPDGKRVAVVWQHNDDAADPHQGEPTAWATIGDPADPASFTSPQFIGKRPYAYTDNATASRKGYNVRHNEPSVVALADGGFLALTLGMNANGYAQGMPPTGNHYVQTEVAANTTSWGAPGFATAVTSADGLTASEMSSHGDGGGGAHTFGQMHTGGSPWYDWGGAFGHIYRAPGGGTWDATSLGASYRPNYETTGIYYFVEGGGYASKTRNSKGTYTLHAAFSWNKRGGTPNYGLYYLKSEDYGKTWTNASGSSVSVPLRIDQNAQQAAVLPANLSTTTYAGSNLGAGACTSIAEAADGSPIIARAEMVDSSRAQVKVYTYTGGRWVGAPVGPVLYWNMGGTGVSYNSKTGNVNVVLLDPGSTSTPGRVHQYHQSLAGLRAGSTNWTHNLVASVPNTRNHASSLQVEEVKDNRLVILFEPSYANPARVSPVIVETPMR